MTGPLHNRTYIITGAGKGLGRAYALHLARLGASLVVNNRKHEGERESSAERVVGEITAAGGQAVAEHSDAEDRACGERLLETALEAFGRVDGLIANAGVSEGRSFHKQSLEELHRTLDINLAGTLNAIHPVFRHCYEQSRGAFIVTTSVAGLYGEHGLPAYSTSKAGLIGLARAIGKEGGRHGVRVNALAPYGATQMTEAQLSDDLIERMRPERVAPVVAWLLSDDCPVNGEVVIAGGGRLATAGVREPSPVEIADDADFSTVARAWDELTQRSLERHYGGALDHFAGYLGD
ncbi:SDR family NAD(P)-dependent oxidoreductase [Elongatibacter sediminis]|uniref:SDR family NAD(P)-dependent oxidoreductase n=1 Tax=Elongatibacter sediminis TaxID=3119006 RepID=A0AAW9R6S0_9GAMM